MVLWWMCGYKFYIGFWICLISIYKWFDFTVNFSLLIMDQLTQDRPETDTRPNQSMTIQHIIIKPVFNTLLDLGISRYKPTKRGKKAGRKWRQRMTDSTITNGISVGNCRCDSHRGVTVVCKNDMKVASNWQSGIQDHQKSSFECCEIVFNNGSKGFTPINISIDPTPRSKSNSLPECVLWNFQNFFKTVPSPKET